MNSAIEELLPKIAKGGGIFFFGTLLGRLAGYLFRVIVARWLGASAYGLISMGISFLTLILPLTGLGLQGAVTRFLSMYKGKENPEKIKATLASSIKIVLPWSLLLASLVFVFSSQIAIQFFHMSPFASVLKIFSIGIPLSALSGVFIGGIVAFQQIKYRVYSRSIIQFFGRLALVLLAIFFGFGVLGVSSAYIVAIFLSLIAAFYFLKKLLSRYESSSSSPFIGKKLLKYSLPLMLAGLLGNLVKQLDTLMLGAFKSSEAVGFYNAARPIVGLVPVGSIVVLFFPVISELYGKGNEEEMQEIFKSVTKWVILIALPMTLLLILFSNQILKLLYGSIYTIASGVLKILAVGFLVSYFFVPSRRLIKTFGRTKLILLVQALATGLNIVLNYLLIPRFGIEGAALATAISIALGGVTAGLFAVHTTALSPFEPVHLKILLAGLLATCVTVPLSLLFQSKSLLLLIALVAVFISIYFSSLILLKAFDRKDIFVIKAIGRKFGIKSEWLKRLIERGMKTSKKQHE